MNLSAGDSDIHEGLSHNYEYVIKSALELADVPDPKVLDYGCGNGVLVGKARKRGLDFQGADTFAGYYTGWVDNVDPDAEGSVSRIENGLIDAVDESFDVVVSNQVFEHIADPPAALGEIARALKRGGTFLAIFPTDDVWFEGHLGIYFVHWMGSRSKLQNTYLRLARKLGFGYHVTGLSPAEWAELSQQRLEHDIFHHSKSDVWKWWKSAFGEEPRSEALKYMRYRIGQNRFAALSRIAALPVMRFPLNFVCRVRANRILVVTKTD